MTTARALRILHVVGAMNRGGVETWLMHVLRNSDRHKFQHDFVVHSNVPALFDDEIRSLGSAIVPITSTRKPGTYQRELGTHLDRHGPYDVVHSHVHHFSGLVMRVAYRKGIRCRIAHSHSDTRQPEAGAGLLRRSYLRLTEYWIDRYATHGIGASSEAIAALARGPYRRWSVLYCGVDFAPFRLEPDRWSLRRELGIPPDAIVLGHVGRFGPPKNHTFLLRIAAAMAPRVPRSRLLLVGDGPLRKDIERHAESLGIGHNVIFGGSRNDVAALLRGAVDIFVFPSTHEGLPLSCLEAQAAGIPLVISKAITSEVDVVPEAITRLSLTDSPERWADACLEAYARPKPTQSVALERLMASQFNIGTSVNALQALYSADR